MKRKLQLCLCLLASLFMLGCGARPSPPAFAATGEQWDLFVPQDSAQSGCRMAVDCQGCPSGKTGIRLISDQTARFGIRPKANAMAVKSGERYRLSAWVKGDADVAVAAGEPGVLLRATLFSAQSINYTGGHIYVGLKGVAQADPNRLENVPIPTQWTKIEGVIQIPNGVKELKFFVFSWWAKGVVCVDDAKIEKVSDDTPATPLI